MGGGWENKYWTTEEANVYAQNVLNEFIKLRPYFTWTKSAQNAMACMNLKVTNPSLTWSDVHKPLYSAEEAEDFEKMTVRTKETMLNLYKERVFND